LKLSSLDGYNRSQHFAEEKLFYVVQKKDKNEVAVQLIETHVNLQA